MRIARVLHSSSPIPIVALERDGALYSVAALESAFKSDRTWTHLADAADFHSRVIALACAGLAELDDRLLSGDRPTSARLAPGSFLWLAPCAAPRAAFIHTSTLGGEPSYEIGNGRGLLGHDVAVPFPPREAEPDFELCVAAVLRDDLRRATAHEARRAILGYTICGAWIARAEERRARSLGGSATRARDFAPQLGPLLVTADEVLDVGSLRVQARVDADVLRCSRVGSLPFNPAELIAFVSDHIELCAGDVVTSSPIEGGSCASHGRALSYGSVVELTVERIGRLVGRPVRGPEPAEWRERDRSTS